MFSRSYSVRKHVISILEDLSEPYNNKQKLIELYNLKSTVYQEVQNKIMLRTEIISDLKKYHNKIVALDLNFHLEESENQRMKNKEWSYFVPEEKKDFVNEMSLESSLYFKQGLEMMAAAEKMDISTSPLMEYYSLLQVIKGLFLMRFEILDQKQKIFRTHGLSGFNEKKLEGKVSDGGVYDALLLLLSNEYALHFEGKNILLHNNYYTEKRNEKDEIEKIFELNELLDSVNRSITTDFLSPDVCAKSFMIAWIFSSLVRYNPKKWAKIREAKDSPLSKNHRNWKKHIFPRVLLTLLAEFRLDLI